MSVIGYRGVFVAWSILLFVNQAAAAPPHAASIHWRAVPLRSAIDRLQDVFDEPIFVDRRVDPAERVSLDIEAVSAEEVLTELAGPRQLGVCRVGSMLYLGPQERARQLPALIATRAGEIEQLPLSQRASLRRRQSVHWPRLAEPRQLVSSVIVERGWRLENEQLVPHDLWNDGELFELTLAEQLSTLLIGFDLTFQFHPRERTIAIAPVDAEQLARVAPYEVRLDRNGHEGSARIGESEPAGRRKVYTLRVAEQPVRAVLNELTKRLQWPIAIDEAAIRSANRSLDVRVSFAVRNVDQDELLDAILRPAELTFRRDGEQITIVPLESN